jgi:hypothetical protein
VTRLIRPAALFAILAALCAVLAACGSSSSDDPNKLLKDTFSGSKHVKSGKLNVGVDVSAQGVPNLSQPVKVALTGPFQSQGKSGLPKFDFSLSFSGGGQSFSAGAVSTGDKGYLKFQGKAYEVPANLFDQFKQGFQQAQKQGSGANKNQNQFKQLGLDPLDWLKDPKMAGDESVGGADTKHITAQVDVPKFVDDVNVLLKKAPGLGVQGASRLPNGITTQQKQQILSAVKSASFDVWTGSDDKILRKLEIKLDVGQGGRSGKLDFTLEIDNLNEDQTIVAPAGAKPLSELTSQLGGLGLAGALGGGAAAGGGSSSAGGSSSGGSAAGGSSSGSASAQKLQRYSQCLQAAAGDASKAQKCASLLQ